MKFKHGILRTVGITTGCFYLGWNSAYLVDGRIPKSIFTAFSGLPCPTSGGARSFQCLIEGRFTDSIFYNAMTVPILCLLCLTIAAVIVGLAKQNRLTISNKFLAAWGIVLSVSWFLKFISNPMTW